MPGIVPYTYMYMEFHLPPDIASPPFMWISFNYYNSYLYNR